jgi:hypothetical protein
MIELEPDKAEELAKTLRENQVEIEGPDEVDNLDGLVVASIIVTITPVVRDLVVGIIKALKGSSGTIQTPDKTVTLKNASVEEIRAILGDKTEGGEETEESNS